MLETLLTLLAEVKSLVSSAITLIDRLPFLQLAGLAGVAHFAAKQLPSREEALPTRIRAAIVMVLYFLPHLYGKDDDGSAIFEIVLRALLIFVISSALLNVATAFANAMAMRIQSGAKSRQKRRKRDAEAAQAEYEAEETLLKKMPIDDDEREVLLLKAKQQLLERLSRLEEESP
jgi:hypothetical protein